jgi:hypothetical protein
MAQNQSTPDSSRAHTAATAEQHDERERRNAWEDEGGSVSEGVQDRSRYADRAVSGRIVQTGGPGHPFKAVLTHEDGHTSERSFPTMREGEAFIKSMTPVPVKRDSSRDREPGKS